LPLVCVLPVILPLHTPHFIRPLSRYLILPRKSGHPDWSHEAPQG